VRPRQSLTPVAKSDKRLSRVVTVEPTAYSCNLDYLQDELRWIEARAARLVTVRRLEMLDAADGDPASRTWPGEEDSAISPRVLKRRLRDLTREEARLRAEIDARRAVPGDVQPDAAVAPAADADDAALADAAVPPRGLAIDRLAEIYALDDFERAVLLLASAPCFSRRFDELYGELDADGVGNGLTVEVIFNFLEVSFAERIRRRTVFAPAGRLASNDLVAVSMGGRYMAPKDLLTADVDISARTFSLLLGEEALSDDFLEFSSVEEPRTNLAQVVINEEDKQRILSVVERHDDYLAKRKAWGFDDVIGYGRGVLMLFHGPPGTGKTMTAHAIANHVGKRILNVDLPAFVGHIEADRYLPALFREARLQNAILFFDECEVLFGQRQAGNLLMTMLLSEIERFEGIAILATNLPEAMDEALDRRILIKVRFPQPDRQARLEIWRKHLPEAAPLSPDIDLEALADRFEMTGGYIKNAVLVAVADAVHRGGDTPEITMEHLESAARQQLDRPLDDDGAMVRPKVRLDDVVLPPTLRGKVDELIDAARSLRTVLHRWGIGAHLTYGKGVSALFFGEPGTGKTLCAEAIACELTRPLLVAAIPTLVSKYVGETEKNLQWLFSQARAHHAVLFLDEADSLLMERGEGRASRHDDSAVNTFLKLVERHDGVVLLATNLPDKLDPALTRRLTYRLEFPFPDPKLRAGIWRRLLPVDLPTDGPLDLEKLGRSYRLAGGHIKNAVFKAAFRAASGGGLVSQALLEGAAREESDSLRAGKKPPIGFGTPPEGDA
jgi:SpoVK/Ycf46/Vps4 family AAA+-type ATPase